MKGPSATPSNNYYYDQLHTKFVRVEIQRDSLQQQNLVLKGIISRQNAQYKQLKVNDIKMQSIRRKEDKTDKKPEKDTDVTRLVEQVSQLRLKLSYATQQGKLQAETLVIKNQLISKQKQQIIDRHQMKYIHQIELLKKINQR